MTEPMPIRREIVERLVTATGAAMIVRAVMAGAEIKPIGRLYERNDRFVVELDFERPLWPERQTGLVVMLSVLPEHEVAA